jgi:hypothetical protein
MKALRRRTSIAFHLEVVQLHRRSDAQNPLERFCPDSNQGLNIGYQVQDVGVGTGYNRHERFSRQRTSRKLVAKSSIKP